MKYAIAVLIPFLASTISTFAQESDEQRLENFRAPSPSNEPSFGDRLNNATTHTFRDGTTIQPYAGGRDTNVYNNPSDRGGTVGVKITH